jgi:hypothetical protein
VAASSSSVAPLSGSRDPEAVRELLSCYFEVARTVIGRYGGVVEKFKSPTTSPTGCSTAPLTSSPQNRGSGAPGRDSTRAAGIRHGAGSVSG